MLYKPQIVLNFSTLVPFKLPAGLLVLEAQYEVKSLANLEMCGQRKSLLDELIDFCDLIYVSSELVNLSVHIIDVYQFRVMILEPPMDLVELHVGLHYFLNKVLCSISKMIFNNFTLIFLFFEHQIDTLLKLDIFYFLRI